MRKLYRHFALTLNACVALSFATRASAKDEVQKHDIDEQTYDQQKNSSQVFKTLPSFHVSPADDRLILGLAYSHTDLRSDYKRPEEPNSKTPPVEESLRLSGFGINPMIGMTEKMAGIGISTEMGEGHSTYKNFNDGTFERGVLRYTGFGLHAFFNPTPDASYIYVTTNLNIRALNVSQKAKHQNDESDRGTDAVWQKYNYRAYRTHAGANLTLKPFKSFSIIPWGNMSYTYRPDFDKTMNDTDNGMTDKERLIADSDYFLSGGVRVDYGVDLALKVSQFEVHFGNMIGSVLAARQKSDETLQVRDHSLTIGVSFQTPAKRTSN